MGFSFGRVRTRAIGCVALVAGLGLVTFACTPPTTGGGSGTTTTHTTSPTSTSPTTTPGTTGVSSFVMACGADSATNLLGGAVGSANGPAVRVTNTKGVKTVEATADFLAHMTIVPSTATPPVAGTVNTLDPRITELDITGSPVAGIEDFQLLSPANELDMGFEFGHAIALQVTTKDVTTTGGDKFGANGLNVSNSTFDGRISVGATSAAATQVYDDVNTGPAVAGWTHTTSTVAPSVTDTYTDAVASSGASTAFVRLQAQGGRCEATRTTS